MCSSAFPHLADEFYLAHDRLSPRLNESPADILLASHSATERKEADLANVWRPSGPDLLYAMHPGFV